MKGVLIQLDEATVTALNRIAAVGKRKRSEFIREAVRQAEYKAIREAYRRKPDAAADADDWSTAEEYEA